MLLLALLPAALAGDDACLACCRAGGMSSCDTHIELFAEGGRVTAAGVAWQVTGVWQLDCEGRATYSPGETFVMDHAPAGGEVLARGGSPLEIHCFQQACALPSGACFSPPDAEGRIQLVSCGTRQPISAAGLSAPPGPDRAAGAQVVVVNGRPLVVQGDAISAPHAPAPVSSATAPAPAAPAAATVAASAPPSTPADTDPFTLFSKALPTDPPDPCKVVADTLRAEARKRVDLGDEKRLRKDTPGALQEYRVALTMESCNAYAWFGVGEVASEAGRPDLAVRALRNTTRLLPTHPRAWTLLGGAYEALRQPQLAAEAYTKALELRPGLPEALDGWRRTAAPVPSPP